MALSIRHPETEALARELARRKGETLTQAITTALRERLEREQSKSDVSNQDLRAKLRAIRKRVAALPELDNRSADEIIGYDEYGVPR
jgi:antitoxin VapB